MRASFLELHPSLCQKQTATVSTSLPLCNHCSLGPSTLPPLASANETSDQLPRRTHLQKCAMLFLTFTGRPGLIRTYLKAFLAKSLQTLWETICSTPTKTSRIPMSCSSTFLHGSHGESIQILCVLSLMCRQQVLDLAACHVLLARTSYSLLVLL